jgi:hypothetical protein
MSEYESALFEASFISFRVLVRLGANPKELWRELHKRADLAEKWGSENCAETLRLLAQVAIPDGPIGRDTNDEWPRD